MSEIIEILETIKYIFDNTSAFERIAIPAVCTAVIFIIKPILKILTDIKYNIKAFFRNKKLRRKNKEIISYIRSNSYAKNIISRCIHSDSGEIYYLSTSSAYDEVLDVIYKLDDYGIFNNFSVGAYGVSVTIKQHPYRGWLYKKLPELRCLISQLEDDDD